MPLPDGAGEGGTCGESESWKAVLGGCMIEIQNGKRNFEVEWKPTGFVDSIVLREQSFSLDRLCIKYEDVSLPLYCTTLFRSSLFWEIVCSI